MKSKKWKNKNFLTACGHAIDGIKSAFKSETNLKIQMIFAILAIIIAIILKLETKEFVLIILTIGIVLLAEMMNTVVEIILDLYTEQYNENVKTAKDIASGCVLITSVMAVIIGIMIFVPKFIEIYF